MRRSCLAVAILMTMRAGGLMGQEPVPVSVIGVQSGPASRVFGHIVDVAVGRSGDVFILDDQTLEARWFDGRGELRGRTDPAALRSPRALALDAEGALLVLDPLRGRIARFRAGPDGLEHTGDIPAPPAMDFCTIGDRILLVRLRTDSVITALDADGRVVGAWGTLIEPEPGHDLPPDEIRSELDNRARVHCDEATQTVTLLYERIPVVRRFTMAGELEWQVELADYHRVRDVHTPDESGWMAAPDPESGTAHSGRSITVRPDGAIIVTLYEGSAEGGAFEARVLSASTGQELGGGPVPVIIASAESERVVGWVNTPVPRVLSYRGLESIGRAPRDER